MTASLWRRLTDLPPRYGEALGLPEAATTEATKHRVPVLAELLRGAAKALDERALVVLVSETQGGLLRAEDASPARERLLRVIGNASRSASRQRILDLSHRAVVDGAEGDPAAVLLIRDGKIATDASQRSRSRGSYRYTLDDDVVEWVREEAARRGVSASDVVQGELVRARGRR